jgi:hypothetical protein
MSLFREIFLNFDFLQNLLSEMVGIFFTIFGVDFVIKRFEIKRNAYLRTKAVQRAQDMLKKPLGHVHQLLKTMGVPLSAPDAIRHPADDFNFFESYDKGYSAALTKLADHQILDFLQVFFKTLENIEGLFAQFQSILTNQDLRMLLSLTDYLDTHIAKVRFASEKSAAINLAELRSIMTSDNEMGFEATVNRIHRTRVYLSYRLIEELAGTRPLLSRKAVWVGTDRGRYRKFMRAVSR